MFNLLQLHRFHKPANRATENVTEAGIVAPGELLPRAAGHESVPMGPQARHEYM